MKTILVCAALRDQEGHDLAIALLTQKAKPGVKIISGLAPLPEGIDWVRMREVEGGWEGAYRCAARSFDGFCLVPVDGWEGLSRGVFSIAESALIMGKQVIAFWRRRPPGLEGSLTRVHGLTVVNAGEYKGVYGRLVGE